LLSAIYEDKIFFSNFYWQQSVKMITNTDLHPQKYHFLLGMAKGPFHFWSEQSVMFWLWK
jgi:hypothetical protein